MTKLGGSDKTGYLSHLHKWSKVPQQPCTCNVQPNLNSNYHFPHLQILVTYFQLAHEVSLALGRRELMAISLVLIVVNLTRVAHGPS